MRGIFSKFSWVGVVCVILVFTLGGCGRSGSSGENDGRLTILATTGMIGDLVRAVAGEDAKVDVLIGSGIDPHTYTPTRTDVVRIENASAVLYNGLLLEGNLGRTLERVSRTGRRIVPVAERVIAAGAVELLEEDGGDEDPHLWMSVAAWRSALQVVTDQLVEMAIAEESVLRARAAAYDAVLVELHAYATARIASIPEGRRVLITAHDAFGYLGSAYGLEVHGIQGISTDSEAGLREIEALVRLIVDRGIEAVFIESTLPDRNVRALIEGARARGHAVRVGGELFSDAMGLEGTYEGTYLGMIDHNVTTIVRALGGDAPERGWRGELSRAVGGGRE